MRSESFKLLSALLVGTSFLQGAAQTRVNPSQIANYDLPLFTTSTNSPMSNFHAAMSNVRNQVVNIVINGDSFNRCDHFNCGVGGGPLVSDNRPSEHNYRGAAQKIWGSHGTGMIPVVGLMAASPAPVDPEAWTVSGGYDTSSTCLGHTQPGTGQGTLVHLTNGASLTFKDRRNLSYDHANLYFATTGGSGTISVAVDGIPVGTASASSFTGAGYANGGCVARYWRSPAFTATGAHSITFTSTGDTYIDAAEGTLSNAGISVHNVTFGGSRADSTGASPAAENAFEALIPGGVQLYIEQYLTNDTAYQLSTANFSTWLSAALSFYQGLSSVPSVMIAISPVDIVNTVYPEAPYTAAMKGLCSPTVACVNFQDRLGTTYTASQMDQSGVAWSGGNGGIHPIDATTLNEGQMLFAASFNTTSSTSAGSGAGFTCPSSTVACKPPYEAFQLSTSSATAQDSSGLIFANTAGETITLPPATNAADSLTGCGSGIYACGPSRAITVFNSSVGGGAGAITVAAPAGWTLITNGVAGNVSIPAGQSATFATYMGGGAQNWFTLNAPGAGSGGGCTSSCTFAGTTTVAALAAGGNLAVGLPGGNTFEVDSGGYAVAIFGAASSILTNVIATSLSVQNISVVSTISLGGGGIVGSATAPTGPCPTNGAFMPSADGHGSICVSGAWSQRF